MLSLIPSGKWTAGNIAAVAADTAHPINWTILLVLQGEINQLRGWPPGWFSWTSKLGDVMLMTDEIM